MKSYRLSRSLHRESMTQGLALIALLVMGGLAVAGPSGILAWSDSQRLLEQRQKQLAGLELERHGLRNRVDLLDPRHVDPDLAGQLLRDRLNVAHPDEMVIQID